MIDTDLHVSTEMEDTVHILARSPLLEVFFAACTGEILMLSFDGWALQHRKTFSLSSISLVPLDIMMEGPRLIITFEKPEVNQLVYFPNLENVFASRLRTVSDREDLVASFSNYTSKCYTLLQSKTISQQDSTG